MLQLFPVCSMPAWRSVQARCRYVQFERPQACSVLIATGFCRNGPSNDDNMGKTREALEQYRADQMDDIISTTSNVFLGLTLGCARCHDHKIDPVSQREYYSLVSVFAGLKRGDIIINYDGTDIAALSPEAMRPWRRRKQPQMPRGQALKRSWGR